MCICLQGLGTACSCRPPPPAPSLSQAPGKSSLAFPIESPLAFFHGLPSSPDTFFFLIPYTEEQPIWV